ncbi:MAG TPA: hypothetical protein ACFYEK_07110 [Candidatus Wunengus sp. YC60]|uniref:hypothetical protein n=1 Tax=Candidatus Wunengus sp. YC60 TaxID=3367697 RepID=UPI00402607DF
MLRTIKQNMDYLNNKQYYIDRYDRITIKECLEMVDICKTEYQKTLNDEASKKYSAADKAKGSNWVTNQQLYIIKACRYQYKEESIQKWMQGDQIKQEKYDSTAPPSHVSCPDCKKTIQSSIKIFGFSDDPLQMMFLFNCSSCKKKRWLYEDGTEHESPPTLCSKCKANAETSVVREGKDNVIWRTTCTSCGFIETTVDDFEKGRTERNEQEEREITLLQKYREEFCSEKIGKEAFEYIEALKVGKVVFDEELKKYDSLAFQQVIQLNKLSIVELEKKLREILEKEHFIKLSFGNPEVGQHVIVSFNLQDADTSRKQEVSVSSLQKLIKECLEKTNWRLMSDGVAYRLGYLSGRVKGYEREEDFFEISGQKKEEQSSKIDHEKLMEYGGHKVVQLARLLGESKGIENIRKRRLEKEPEGFFLEDNDDWYQCGICRESCPSGKTWWNLNGIRCADCQRNLKAGVIPEEIHKDDVVWIENWRLTSKDHFNIHASTLAKLRRDGLLHGRDLKREDGTVYFTVYLIEENKKFLELYHEKPQPKHYTIDLLGNQIEL